MDKSPESPFNFIIIRGLIQIQLMLHSDNLCRILFESLNQLKGY